MVKVLFTSYIILFDSIRSFYLHIDQKRKKRNLLYYPQQGSHYPMYGIDDDYQGKLE